MTKQRRHIRTSKKGKRFGAGQGQAKIGIILVKQIPMREVIETNKKKGQYWFSPDTMKFFDSQVGGWAYKKGDYAYFISSEKFTGDRAMGVPAKPRRYSIRKMNMTTGDVSTVGEFQEFSTEKSAQNKLALILSNGD